MNFFLKILKALESLFDKGALAAKDVAPLAMAVAPLCGQYAPAVAAGAALTDGIATTVDTAYQAHVAAGSTPQSAAVMVGTVAAAVAANPATDSKTAVQISNTIQALDPVVQAAIIAAPQ